MEGKNKSERKKLGEAIGSVGLLILAFNFIDFFAGWNALADETAIFGIALALIGAFLVLIS